MGSIRNNPNTSGLRKWRPARTILTVGHSSVGDPSPVRLREALAWLDGNVPEDAPSVSLSCGDTEWSLGTFPDGLTIWMNQRYDHYGYGRPRHMVGVPREKVLALWKLLAAGRLADIERELWLPGDTPAKKQKAMKGKTLSKKKSKSKRRQQR